MSSHEIRYMLSFLPNQAYRQYPKHYTMPCQPPAIVSFAEKVSRLLAHNSRLEKPPPSGWIGW